MPTPHVNTVRAVARKYLGAVSLTQRGGTDHLFTASFPNPTLASAFDRVLDSMHVGHSSVHKAFVRPGQERFTVNVWARTKAGAA